MYLLAILVYFGLFEITKQISICQHDIDNKHEQPEPSVEKAGELKCNTLSKFVIENCRDVSFVIFLNMDLNNNVW